MIEQAPILVILTPLISAVIAPILGLFRKNLCYPWAILALSFSTICSIITISTVLDTGTIHYFMGNWAPPWGIEYVIDHLNASVLVLINSISLLVAVSSKKLIFKELPDKEVYFYTVFLLQVTGFSGIVITGDLFNLYVFLEIAAITGYALIAIGEEHAAFASFKYIVMGTIGACFYLLGVGFLYMATGTLNMADLSRILPGLYHSKLIIVAFSFFIVGVAIKMALPPLHTWLTDAYTYAPSATSSLVAPLMTKISVYIIIRLMFTVFEPSFSIELYPVTEILGWVAAAGIIFAGIMALAQTDLKRMFSYLIMAEIGYIIIGIATANKLGLSGAILHIINDVLMMTCLFLTVGAIYYKTGTRNIYKLGTLHRKMPVTLAVFVVGALSIVGIPPFCGFFSKWYLILGIFQAEKWIFLAVLIISSLINAVLFFRILENAYVEPREEEDNHAHHNGAQSVVSLDEAPASMLVPMIVVAVGIILLGIFSSNIISNIIEFAIPASMM